MGKMKIDAIQERMEEYSPNSKVEEENAFKEICQEIALAGLSRGKFFKLAGFQGGTCLRIIYGLRRFSEDLDFILQKSDPQFNWNPFFSAIESEFESFGLDIEIIERTKAPETVKNAFLKQDSFGKVLRLRYPRWRSDPQKVVIKLEIDTNPPDASQFENHFLVFPYPFSIISQDRSSLFAGKCHALLCREYEKGRDWFDFLWYIRKKIPLNFELLKNSLVQSGPYQNTEISLSRDWILQKLKEKIVELDWKKVVLDVEKFISHDQADTLKLWNKEFFLAMAEKLI